MTALSCFVIMPFDEAFHDFYNVTKEAVRTAVAGEDILCYSLDEKYAAGKITDDIVSSIRGAALCIADVTNNNPNVMWETGFAMALDKPTIIATQDKETLPFNLHNQRVQEYSADDMDAFAECLRRAVRDTLATYEIAVGPSQPASGPSSVPVIAVTGSMQANRARVWRRIEQLVAPYLGRETRWLTGSAGATDEVVTEYLVERQERVTAVGYNRLDLSQGVRQMVENGNISFIDATVEELPRLVDSPSERDLLFCTRADMIMLLWDGKSSGTQQLLRFFEGAGRSTLVGFT